MFFLNFPQKTDDGNGTHTTFPTSSANVRSKYTTYMYCRSAPLLFLLFWTFAVSRGPPNHHSLVRRLTPLLHDTDPEQYNRLKIYFILKNVHCYRNA